MQNMSKNARYNTVFRNITTVFKIHLQKLRLSLFQNSGELFTPELSVVLLSSWTLKQTEGTHKVMRFILLVNWHTKIDGTSLVKWDVCQTNLKLPHQKCNKGPIHAAFGDENTVGQFAILWELQKFLCRKFEDWDEWKEEISQFTL